MIYYSIYIYLRIYIYTYIYILVWLDTPSSNIRCYSKFRETIPSSKLTHVFLQKSCMFLVIESSLSPKFWRILRWSSRQFTLNRQDCRKNWGIQRCWIVFVKICLPSIKRIMYMFFQEHILFLRFGQIVSRYTSKVTHWSNDPKIKEFLGISAFLEPCFGTLSLRSIPSHKWCRKTIENRTLKVQQAIHWIWKWRGILFQVGYLIISLPPDFNRVVANSSSPAVSAGWLESPSSEPGVIPVIPLRCWLVTTSRKKSKVRSAEVTYPPEV